MTDDVEQKLLATTNAKVWTEEYMKLFGDKPVDEDTLLVWFANAIETGRTAGERKMLILATAATEGINNVDPS